MDITDLKFVIGKGCAFGDRLWCSDESKQQYHSFLCPTQGCPFFVSAKLVQDAESAWKVTCSDLKHNCDFLEAKKNHCDSPFQPTMFTPLCDDVLLS